MLSARGPRPHRPGDLPRWFAPAVAAVALAGLVLALRFVWWSGYPYLAVSWMPDDAFYYLQPAWMTRHVGGYTFDGSSSMYGFQPLWMLALTALARFTGDKELLLRMALTCAALLHATAGALLGAWLARGGHPWRGLAGASLWLINPPLMHLAVSGMEAPLYASLLLLVVAGFPRWSPPGGASSPWRWWGDVGYGALCGLLVLCRVETVLLVASLLALRLYRGRRGLAWPRRVSPPLLALGGILAVTGPWALYAATALGGVLPTSGQVKLVGGPARVVRALAPALPGAAERRLTAALPPVERLIATAPDLEVPTPRFVWSTGVVESLEWSLGYWLPSPAHAWGAGLRRVLLLPLLAVFLALAARGAARYRWPRAAPGTGVLGAWALASVWMNTVLLMPYARQQFWHRVPDALLAVAVLAHAVPLARAALGAAPRLRAVAAALAAGTLAGSLWVAAGVMAPRTLEGGQASNAATWEAARWLDEHLPAGTRVGSWHAGALGYLVRGPVVVNLDGLANSRQYVDRVVRGEALWRLGRSDENPTLAYLDERGITWVADVERPERLGTAPFQQVIPPRRYEVRFTGDALVPWDRDEPTHRVVVVRLRGAVAE